MRNTARHILERAFLSWPGRCAVSGLVTLTQNRVFSPWTARLMRFDSMRLHARAAQQSGKLTPSSNKLHFGCGARRVEDWLNVDVAGTDCDVDLAGGRLPWNDAVFDAIVGQHVVEHLELESELLPLVRELRRVSRAGSEIWLSCPDMEKICRSYLESKGADLIEDRLTRRHGDLGMDGIPSQHFINKQFCQGGEHKNLFDFELLDWALRDGGFSESKRASEDEFLAAHPDFPRRGDDFHSLYVRAIAG